MIEDTMWCCDWFHLAYGVLTYPISLGERTEDERNPSKVYWIIIWVWMNFHYTTMHNDSVRLMKYQTLNVCCTIHQLLTSVKYKLFQQDGLSQGYSIVPRDGMEGTKAKCHLFVNCRFYNYNTITLHIFISNLRDQ